jgi:hypothetical protein
MKKTILSLLILICNLCVSAQIQDISGRYISKYGDQEYELHLMTDSSFTFYQPQNNMYGLCKSVNGIWTLRKNKLMLSTDMQVYYEFKREVAKEDDSISFEILGIHDFDIAIYPFTQVFILNDIGEKLYEGEINENGYIKFPSSDIKGNKMVIPFFLSMYLSGEYSNYIEKGFDYKLIVANCGFDIWENEVLKIKNDHILILKVGKFKYEYIKQ